MPPRWTVDTFDAPQATDKAAKKGHRILKLTAEFDTEFPDELAAMVDYLLHPLDVLGGKPLSRDSEAPPRAFVELADPDKVDNHLKALSLGAFDIETDTNWRVITTIHNHHRGLNPRINMFSATVSTEEKTVAQTVHKQTENQ